MSPVVADDTHTGLAGPLTIALTFNDSCCNPCSILDDKSSDTLVCSLASNAGSCDLGSHSIGYLSLDPHNLNSAESTTLVFFHL